MKLIDDIGVYGNTLTKSKLIDDIGVLKQEKEYPLFSGVKPVPTDMPSLQWSAPVPKEPEIRLPLPSSLRGEEVSPNVFDFQIQRATDQMLKSKYGDLEKLKKEKELQENVLRKVPTVALAFAQPGFAVAYEGLQQFKNVAVNKAKTGQWKFTPLENRLISELMPEATPTGIKIAGSVVENVADVALIGGLANLTRKLNNLAKEGLLKETFKTIGNKLEKAGYGTDKVVINIDAIKQAAKGSTIEKEINRYYKALKSQMPISVERQLPSPEQITQKPVLPLFALKPPISPIAKSPEVPQISTIEPPAVSEQALPLFTPKETINLQFERLKRTALENGLNEAQAVKWAKANLQGAPQEAPRVVEVPEQIEMGAEGGIESFGRGRKGEQDMFEQKQPAAQPSVEDKDLAARIKEDAEREKYWDERGKVEELFEKEERKYMRESYTHPVQFIRRMYGKVNFGKFRDPRGYKRIYNNLHSNNSTNSLDGAAQEYNSMYNTDYSTDEFYKKIEDYYNDNPIRYRGKRKKQTKEQRIARLGGDITGEENLLKEPSGDIDKDAIIKKRISKSDFEKLVERWWNSIGKSSGLDEDYNSANDYLQKRDIDTLSIELGSDSDFYTRMMDILGKEGSEISVDNVISAYKNDVLESHIQKETYRPEEISIKDIPIKELGIFWNPQKIALSNPKEIYDIASMKSTGKDKGKIEQARRDLFIMYNTEQNLHEKLGISKGELGKKIRTISAYPVSGRDIQMELNAGVPEQFRWVGIQNSSFINKAKFEPHSIDKFVKVIKIIGEKNGFYTHTGEWLRNYIIRAFLGIDTRIVYSDLTFTIGKFDKSSVKGQFFPDKILIKIENDISPYTIAHEIGHYLDHKWAREVGLEQSLSQGGYNWEYIQESRKLSDEHIGWVKNFIKFVKDISNRSDISNEYTQRNGEVFARFVDKFVRWVNDSAGVKWGDPIMDYRDKFLQSDYKNFVKLLQQKSYIDEKYNIQTKVNSKRGVVELPDIIPNKSKLTNGGNEIDVTAKDLVESRTREEIQDKLQKIFGTYEDLEKMEDGDIPYTKIGELADDYMADLEYAAVNKDLDEVKKLLHNVSEGKPIKDELPAEQPSKEPYNTPREERAVFNITPNETKGKEITEMYRRQNEGVQEEKQPFRIDKPQQPELNLGLPPKPPNTEHDVSVMNLPVEQKVNILDYIRTPLFVLKKIGLKLEADRLKKAYAQYQRDIKTEIQRIKDWKMRVPDKESAKNIFRYLDGWNNKLTDAEQKVADEIRDYLDVWADKLKLPSDKRISKYITHIFEDDFIKKEFDAELAKIIDKRIPGSVYDPFLLQRLGKLGYIEDVWRALQAYTKRAVRKWNMDPALEMLKKAAASHPIENEKYLLRLTSRINLRPTEIDNLIDNFIKSVPGIGYKLSGRPTANITKSVRRIIYRGALGLNFGSAIRNITQGINTYSQLGEKWTARGYYDLMTKGIKEVIDVGAMDDSLVQDENLAVYKKALEKVDEVLFYFFQLAEKINRGSAYYGAKAKALKEGKSLDEAIQSGIDLVTKTQFRFGAVESPVALASDIVKTITTLQTFNIKQSEFLINMLKDKQYAGILRWIAATVVAYATIGSALGWRWKDIIPSVGLGVPGTEVIGKILKYIGAPEKEKKSAAAEVLRTGAILVPAGVQARKTIKGAGDIARGYAKTATGRVKFPVSPTIKNKLMGTLFGERALLESKTYTGHPLGEKQSERLKQSNEKSLIYEALMRKREANKERKQRKEEGKRRAREYYNKR